MVLTLSLALVAGACAPKPKEVSVEDFYMNNTLMLVTNGSVGGSTDFAGRLFASYWAEITGGPAMKSTVMPGGGGIEGVNYMYKNAEPDGLTLGNTHHPSDMAAPYLLGTPGPEGDPTTLGWIGFFGQSPWVVFVGADSSYQSADDLRNAGKQVWGSGDPGSVTSVGAILAIDLLGLDADVVFGMESGENALAVKRGEIIAYCQDGGSGLAAVKNGLAKPFVNMGFTRTEWFPDTPAITELVDLTPEQEEMVRFVSAMIGGKSFFFPPGVPADKLNYARRAFDKIVVHKGFLRQAKLKIPVWEKPITGKELEADVSKVLGMPPEKAQAIRNLVQGYVK